MAIVEMKKVTIIGLQKEKPEILKAVQEMGCVEIQEVGDVDGIKGGVNAAAAADNTKTIVLEQRLSQIKYTLDFLGRYNKEKKGMFAGKKNVTLSRLSEVMAEENQAALLDVAARCREIDENISSMRSKRLRLINLREQMLPWESLDIPVEEIARTEKTEVAAGMVGRERAEEFMAYFDAAAADDVRSDENLPEDSVFIRSVSSFKGNNYYLVIYHKDFDSVVSGKLKELGFSRVSFSGLSGTPREIIEGYNREIGRIDNEEKETADQTAKYFAYIDELQILYDGLSIELEKHRAMERIFHTSKAFVAKGWTKKSDVKMVADRLYAITDALQIEFEDPADDEEIPVVLKNPKLVEPFEVVTNLYSTPSPKGIDPNIAMAPFFFAFFGIMMGDAGYGLLMSIAGILLLKKLKPKDTFRKMCILISLTGLSTLIWGALSGGWLGDLGDKIVRRFGLESTALWFSPMQEPVLMLIFCFALGLIHVFVGMGLKAYMSIRDGKIWDAIFDQGFWFVLLIGLLLLVSPLASVGKYMALGGAAGLVLTQGRDKKNIIARFFSGLLSLYNITGILSDVLSYSRLFALGLASGVIGMVINLLALMMMARWYTFIFGLAIMIGGHVFNIAINVLGAFVHSARLQYIEFFSKFFEGGGRAFSPLTFKTKYIELSDSN